MNKYRKEDNINHNKTIEGFTEYEVKAVDLGGEIEKKIEKLARTIHADKFSEEYVDETRKKRDDLAINNSAENGISVSEDTYLLCVEEAKKLIFSDLELQRPPAKTCIFCNKSIKDIGGRRITAQKFRGVTLSKNKTGGGNTKYPRQSLELFSEPITFICFWGEKEKWTESAIMSAKNAYLNGKQPWFCQICGKRKCDKCATPINYPMGSDILYDDGHSSHAAILPFNPGCINTDCDNYKYWEN